MGRRATTVEETGFGKHEASGANRCDPAAPGQRIPQEIDHCLCRGHHLRAAAHDQRMEVLVAEPLRRDGHPARGSNLAACFGKQNHVIGRLADVDVRDLKHRDHGKAHDLVAWREDEAEPFHGMVLS